MARTDTLGNFLTDVAIAIRNKKGTTDTIVASNFDTEIESIETGGGTTEPIFTGHYDTEGLRQIGWTDEEIEYYNQNGVQWNSSEDNYFKLTQTELAGDDSKNTRFLPKSSTLTYFKNYNKLLAIPNINTNNNTGTSSMFNNCYLLTTIPQFDTSNKTNMNSMFNNCYSLTMIPQLDTSKVTNMSSMFYKCYSLITIPQLNTSSVIYMDNMFSSCNSLITIPQLNTSSVTDINGMFYNCSSPETLGGFLNLGQAYKTTASANYSSYKLDLSSCKKLTEQSLINVLTNLYDIKTKGCKAQQVVIGSTNLAKLTSEEGQQALSNAQAKGWTVS